MCEDAPVQASQRVQYTMVIRDFVSVNSSVPTGMQGSSFTQSPGQIKAFYRVPTQYPTVSVAEEESRVWARLRALFGF